MPQPTDRTLAVIGSTSVGKSALTDRFTINKFPENYDPTISRTLIKSFKNKSNGREYILTVYDTAGLEKQEQILEQHIDSDGFILVYSIADRHSFEIIKEIYNKLVDDKNTPNINIILIGNKTDLNDKRRVSYEAGLELVKEWTSYGSIVSFIETSARTGEKVEEVFITLLDSIDRKVNNSNGYIDTEKNMMNKSEAKNNPKKTNQCIIC